MLIFEKPNTFVFAYTSRVEYMCTMYYKLILKVKKRVSNHNFLSNGEKMY